jgi:hypothetical protein
MEIFHECHPLSFHQRESLEMERGFIFFFLFLGIPIDPIRQNREEKEKRKRTG